MDGHQTSSYYFHERPLTESQARDASIERFNRALSTLASLADFDCSSDAVQLELKSKLKILSSERYIFVYQDIPGTKERALDVISTLKPHFNNECSKLLDLLSQYVSMV